METRRTLPSLSFDLNKKKILACAVIENKCPTINTSSDNEIKEPQDRQWFPV